MKVEHLWVVSKQASMRVCSLYSCIFRQVL